MTEHPSKHQTDSLVATVFASQDMQGQEPFVEMTQMQMDGRMSVCLVTRRLARRIIVEINQILARKTVITMVWVMTATPMLMEMASSM